MTTMRPIRETIPVEEAKALLMEAAIPIERTERIPVRDAMDRVLAAAVISTIDVPPFARAAMDGYAVIAEDTFGAGRYDAKVLRSIETVYTGAVPSRALSRGECIEIATGAPLPQRADAVVMVEETEKTDGGGVRVFTPVYPGQHVGRRAADIAAGQTVLPAGVVLNPSRAGSVCLPLSAPPTSTCTRSRASRSCLRAMKLSTLGTRSDQDRSTTSTSSRCRRLFARTAASP